MIDLHIVQLHILRDLLLKSPLSFTDLNSLGLTNDHFTFHIKKLLKLGYVVKLDEGYSLTTKGNELAGRLDKNSALQIPQPKVSISLIIIDNEKKKILLSERKVDQSKGKIAWHTAKIRLGESLYETCRRCLKEETGLEGEFEYSGATHIIRKSSSANEIDVVIQDFKVKNITGTLLAEVNSHFNKWYLISEIMGMDDNKLLVLMKEKIKMSLSEEIKFHESIVEE